MCFISSLFLNFYKYRFEFLFASKYFLHLCRRIRGKCIIYPSLDLRPTCTRTSAMNDLSVAVNNENSHKVPSHFRLVKLHHKFPSRLCRFAVHIALFEKVKAWAFFDAEFATDEIDDFLFCVKFLVPKLTARESEDFQALILILLLKSLQGLVGPGSFASLRSHIDGEANFSLKLGVIERFSSPVSHWDFMKGRVRQCHGTCR